jgi:hypothetical protein
MTRPADEGLAAISPAAIDLPPTRSVDITDRVVEGHPAG